MESDSLFPEPSVAQETLVGCLREVGEMLDDEQRQHDAELAARRGRHLRKIAWLREQQESGKTPTYGEWCRMMDETGWPTEERDASFRSRYERGARMARAFSRATGCLLCLRAVGVPRAHLQEVHLMLQETLRIRAARPLDDPKLLSGMMAAMFEGTRAVQSLCEGVKEQSPDVTANQVMERAMEYTRRGQAQEDRLQQLTERRHAQRTAWRDELRRVLQATLELAEALPPPTDEPEETLPLAPSAEELVAHLQAALVMLREGFSRAQASWRRVRANEDQPPVVSGPVKPIGPLLERSRAVHLTALFGRCEEILLAQDPELRKPVQATYESLVAFRIYRATARWKESPEPAFPTSLEQIKADFERCAAERDREAEEREEQQIALLTTAVEQARRLAAATR